MFVLLMGGVVAQQVIGTVPSQLAGVCSTNGISIGLAVFSGLTIMPNTASQTTECATGKLDPKSSRL